MIIERRAEPPKRRLDRLITQIDGNPQSFLFQGAQEGEIVLMEERLGRRLPSSYRRFLAHTDGAFLFQTEEFFGTKSDVSDNATRKSILEVVNQVSDLTLVLIPFHQNAGVLHCFDTSSAKLGGYKEYPVVIWDQTNRVAIRVKNSFTEFLEEIVGQYG